MIVTGRSYFASNEIVMFYNVKIKMSDVLG